MDAVISLVIAGPVDGGDKTPATMSAWCVESRVALTEIDLERAQLVQLLNHGEALKSALHVLVGGSSAVAWVAEPRDRDDNALQLSHVVGDRTGALRGLSVPDGLGLTGMVRSSRTPHWVNDYFTANSITHNFDRPVHAEGVARLLAVPMLSDGACGGVLAFGARETGEFGDRLIEQVVEVARHATLAVVVAKQARLAREIALAEERRRIAADLHDSVGALLYAIGSGVAGLAAAPAALDPVVAAGLRRLQGLAADATSALRDSVRRLHTSPAALALAVSIRADCSAFSDRTGVRAELINLDTDAPELPQSRAAVLVSGVREALLNVEKHADANAVVITTSSQADVVTVAVTDDGTGLAPDHRPGIGLTLSRDAFARLGGSLNVTSDPSGGTTWRARLPC